MLPTSPKLQRWYHEDWIVLLLCFHGILRLSTLWYEMTMAELLILCHRLQHNHRLEVRIWRKRWKEQEHTSLLQRLNWRKLDREALYHDEAMSLRGRGRETIVHYERSNLILAERITTETHLRKLAALQREGTRMSVSSIPKNRYEWVRPDSRRSEALTRNSLTVSIVQSIHFSSKSDAFREERFHESKGSCHKKEQWS